MNTHVNAAGELTIVAPSPMTELVRGNEQSLLTLFTPVVREQSIALDFSQVERIDAAGIAALISLFDHARQTGHKFTLCNVSHRVEEILALVGLDHILVTQDAAQVSLPHEPEPCCDGRAA
ncbi:MAG TPA: STAS domain-containing protein [Terracidiphilus sp.]|nr:STAS domain-containing protein [Terracidiphilus sp.]